MPLSLSIRHDDHVRGNPAAALVVIMYADYQCPTCRQANAALADLQRRLGAQMGLVMRPFPQTDRHSFAALAAEAAEAAAAQGAFWPMHEALFSLQEAFEPDLLPALAERLGLDADLLTEDVLQHAFELKVAASTATGTHLGVVATPTLFINGERYDGDLDEASVAGAMMRYVA